jgi:hypothetical protein
MWISVVMNIRSFVLWCVEYVYKKDFSVKNYCCVYFRIVYTLQHFLDEGNNVLHADFLIINCYVHTSH